MKYTVQPQEDGTYIIVDENGAMVGDTFYTLRREALAEKKRLEEAPAEDPAKKAKGNSAALEDEHDEEE